MSFINSYVTSKFICQCTTYYKSCHSEEKPRKFITFLAFITILFYLILSLCWTSIDISLLIRDETQLISSFTIEILQIASEFTLACTLVMLQLFQLYRLKIIFDHSSYALSNITVCIITFLIFLLFTSTLFVIFYLFFGIFDHDRQRIVFKISFIVLFIMIILIPIIVISLFSIKLLKLMISIRSTIRKRVSNIEEEPSITETITTYTKTDRDIDDTYPFHELDNSDSYKFGNDNDANGDNRSEEFESGMFFPFSRKKKETMTSGDSRSSNVSPFVARFSLKNWKFNDNRSSISVSKSRSSYKKSKYKYNSKPKKRHDTLSYRQSQLLDNIIKQALLIFFENIFLVGWLAELIYILFNLQDFNESSILFFEFKDDIKLWISFLLFEMIGFTMPGVCVWLTFAFAKNEYLCLCEKCHKKCYICCSNWTLKLFNRKSELTYVDKDGNYNIMIFSAKRKRKRKKNKNTNKNKNTKDKEWTATAKSNVDCNGLNLKAGDDEAETNCNIRSTVISASNHLRRQTVNEDHDNSEVQDYSIHSYSTSHNAKQTVPVFTKKKEAFNESYNQPLMLK